MELKSNCLKISIMLAVIYFTHLTACHNQKQPKEVNQEHKLFSLLTPDHTGIYFDNTITRTNDLNIFIYQDFYSGAVSE